MSNCSSSTPTHFQSAEQAPSEHAAKDQAAMKTDSQSHIIEFDAKEEKEKDQIDDDEEPVASHRDVVCASAILLIVLLQLLILLVFLVK